MEREPNPQERKELKYSDGKENYTFKPDYTVIMSFRNRDHAHYGCILKLSKDYEIKKVLFGNEWLRDFMLDLETDGLGNSMSDYFGWQPRHVVADTAPDWIIDGFWELQRSELEHPEDLIG